MAFFFIFIFLVKAPMFCLLLQSEFHSKTSPFSQFLSLYLLLLGFKILWFIIYNLNVLEATKTPTLLTPVRKRVKEKEIQDTSH